MFRPLYDYVLVREIAQDRTVEGVTLPDVAREDMKFGQVVETGSGRALDMPFFMPDAPKVGPFYRAPLEVRVGNYVAFGPHAGMRISIQGNEFLLMREAEIKGIFEDETQKGGAND